MTCPAIYNVEISRTSTIFELPVVVGVLEGIIRSPDVYTRHVQPSVVSGLA